MMRSDMPKQVTAYRNGGGIPSLATVPMETTMAGQPHRLAYVNPIEEEMMKQMGGAGLPGPGGIPSYFIHKPNSFLRNVFSGGSDDDDDSSSEGPASIGVESGSSGNTNIGIVDSVLMGLGLKEATPEYYAATANTIAATQGSEAANNYISGLDSDDVPSGTFDAINSSIDTITSSGENFDNSQPTGGAGSEGSSASSVSTTADDTTTTATATETATDTTTTTPFVLNEDQLTAQSNYMNRIADYMGTFSADQLSDVGQRRGIYDRDFAPTRDEFMAITGVDENLAQVLLSTQPGQNYDLRDWSKIMASDNPLEAAQAATAALYMTPGLYGAGQTIGTGQTIDAIDNVIAETDQLYAYVDSYRPYNERYGVDEIKIGIKTPDGVLLTGLGSLSNPTVGENLARFGYGTEDIAELIDPIRQYYTENFEFNPSYYGGLQKVSDGRYVGNNRNVVYGGGNTQTDQLSQLLGQDVVVQQPDGTYAVMDTFGLGQGAISGENIDPFGTIANLQNMQQTTTGDLATGQGYLLGTTPGFFGNPALNIIDQSILDEQNAAAANAEAQQAAAAEAAQYSSGQPVLGSAAQNTGMQTYSALVPSTGTSTAGIAGLPSTNIGPATNNPYAFTAYTPGTYNPVVNPLVLPPLG